MIKISNLKYTEVIHIHGSTIISMVFFSDVLVEVQNTKTIFTYFYYKYLQLRILLAHLRVTRGNE